MKYYINFSYARIAADGLHRGTDDFVGNIGGISCEYKHFPIFNILFVLVYNIY